ncbi:hypothetical protein CPB86DRAFT_823443 [Serendipita vermifera]|nr:hypothetical protein CPB86DRAFT_823443 [Serendipita vermifera]
MARFDELPEELYLAILECIPDPKERTPCTVALARALPRSPISWRWFYHYVSLQGPKNVLALYQQLRKRGGKSSSEASWIHELSSESWEVDAQILADLLNLLQGLRKMNLHIGTTFAPEHLDDVFQHPRSDLLSLNLVFKPYVQKATYYQFLKGAYFDSLLSHISSWSTESKLRHLSIVQTLPPSPTIFHSFAQPIVFFSLDPLSKLIHSAALQNVTHLRIQIPSRTIADFLCRTSSSTSQSTTSSLPLPSLRLLDLSTTQLSPSTLARLLGTYHDLEHLIIDDCSVVSRSIEISGEFAELGRLCALAGMKRAKEREQVLKQVAEAARQAATEEAERIAAVKLAEMTTATPAARQNKNANCSRLPRAGNDPPGSTIKLQNLNDSSGNTNSPSSSTTTSFSRTKKGRKGLATATFSIREKKQVGAPLTTHQLSSLLSSSTSNPSSSSSSPSSGTVSASASASAAAALEKIRILPPIPSLHSLSLTTFAPPTDTAQRHAWESDFAKGWEEGVRTLKAVYKRLYTSRSNKLIRLYRFASTRARGECGDDDDDDDEETGGEQGVKGRTSGVQMEALRGLVEVDIEKELIDAQTWAAPKLCFGGTTGSSIPHAEDCGHQVSWELAGI